MKDLQGECIYIQSNEHTKIDEIKGLFNFPADTIWLSKKKKKNPKIFKDYNLCRLYKQRDSISYEIYARGVSISYTPVDSIKDKKLTVLEITENKEIKFARKFEIYLRDNTNKNIKWTLVESSLPKVDIIIPKIGDEILQTIKDSIIFTKSRKQVNIKRIEFKANNIGSSVYIIDNENNQYKLDTLLSESEYQELCDAEAEEQQKYLSQNYYLKEMKSYPIGDTILFYEKDAYLRRYDKERQEEVTTYNVPQIEKNAVVNNIYRIIGIGNYGKYIIEEIGGSKTYATSMTNKAFISQSHLDYIKTKYVNRKFVFTDSAYSKTQSSYETQFRLNILNQHQQDKNVTVEEGMVWVCSDIIVGYENSETHTKTPYLIMTNKYGDTLGVDANLKGQGEPERTVLTTLGRYRLPIIGKDFIYLDDYLELKNKEREKIAKKEAEVLKKKKEEERKKAEERKAREERNKQLREERLVRLKSKYSDRDVELILSGSLRIGMTKEMCKESWGEPKRVNKTTTAYGVREQWVYYNSYLYFENGILTTIQN